MDTISCLYHVMICHDVRDHGIHGMGIPSPDTMSPHVMCVYMIYISELMCNMWDMAYKGHIRVYGVSHAFHMMYISIRPNDTTQCCVCEYPYDMSCGYPDTMSGDMICVCALQHIMCCAHTLMHRAYARICPCACVHTYICDVHTEHTCLQHVFWTPDTRS